MIDITVLAVFDTSLKTPDAVDRLMNNRLTALASDLQTYLYKIFAGERGVEDLVIYLGYNNKYAVQWKIVSDVSSHIGAEVAKCCNNLGYLPWNDVEL
ncbi:hypothetical protein J7E50_02525 [Pedobacter sp. ISL-68]|uniref:hypothetical protein n=1 Tax=unclassified Pedobacter TaxID=2628915 RepID=UPI001BE8420E|nr:MULTISPECIES: hypothetical protein [unclassified Pedobacter]MBT2560096.1 hypothetical protein [Pedobacter sp. ISL-64]MBT2589075.1 hypothetical protein [Pedobacter sp. ISL-68]